MTARSPHTPHKVKKHRKIVTRMRGKRSREKEVVSRVYSPRWETKLAQHAVAYKPYKKAAPISGESTAIYAMKYDPKTKLLWVTFWKYKMKGKGSTYVFYNVPNNIWVAFNEASSKGRFFYYNIRTKFNHSRVK